MSAANNTPSRQTLEGTPSNLDEIALTVSAVPARSAAVVSGLAVALSWLLHWATSTRVLWMVVFCASVTAVVFFWSREQERWETVGQRCRLAHRLYESGAKSKDHGAPKVKRARVVRSNGAVVREFTIDTRWHSPLSIIKAAPHCAGLLGVETEKVSATERPGGVVIIRALLQSAHD